MSFMGLEIGKRAIMVNQTALNIVGHNMANANTDGYTRQVADLVASKPLGAMSLNSSTSVGQLGTGVDIDSVARLRDAYVDNQYRYENTSLGYWSATEQTLDNIQTIVNEPSDNGLRSVLDKFWQSWQDLSTYSENESNRAVVAQRGQAVADAFQSTYKQLTDLRNDLNANVQVDVDQVNSIGSQLKELNLQIAAITISGQQPNDLSDKRDLLIDQLSKLVNIKVNFSDNGMATVQVGGRSLVQGTTYNALTVKDDSEGMHMVIWADTQTKTQITGGELMSNLDARGKTNLPEDLSSDYKETVPNMIDQLNSLAKTIVTKTNEIHSQGYSLNNTSTTNPDGTDFFTMPTGLQDQYINWAKTMSVSAAIVDDPKNIAAATKPTYDANGKQSNFGDGDNALAIAALKQDMNSEPASLQTRDITVVSPATISLTVRYGAQTKNVTIPSSVYGTIDDIRSAIESNINSAFGFAGTVIHVNADITNPNRLDFSSSDYKFEGIDNLTIGSDSYGSYSVQTVKGETTDDYWRALAAEVGVKAQEATRNSTNQDQLVTELDNKRQTVSGVSLDEEATDMIKYQHAFNAAARFITVIDDMLDTLVNKTGIAGR
ncbi:MAG TPA: flagellar hook-associated protein FlgK [Syntrophomonadaceae bacterium]|nr:flagellar hook-associated protein FlgK [Syntrophomonadaceae bacterium]